MNIPSAVISGVLVLFFCSAGFAEIKNEQIDPQETCGKSAAETFSRGYGNGSWKDENTGTCVATFASHYNTKLDKCFIKVQTNCRKKLSSYYEKTLLSIRENRDYGVYYLVKENSTLMSCRVRGTSCNSESQWDALIQPFMTE